MTRPENILIIEDEVIVSESIRQMLKNLGYRAIKIVNNAKKASSLLNKNDYDIVLMDINLGEGEDGIDVINGIRSKKEVPVIYLTGKSDTETLGRAKKTLPKAFITKPVTETNLKIQLDLFIRKPKKAS